MDKLTQKTMFSSVKPDWGTPMWLFDLLNKEFNFTLDVAAQINETQEEFALRRPSELHAMAMKLRRKHKMAPDSALVGQPHKELLDFASRLVPRKANFKCPRFFTELDDAFKQKWTGAWFLNPPYGRGIGKWMQEAKRQSLEQKSVGVVLVPARTDTRWFWDHCLAGATQIRLLKGRLCFEGGVEHCAPFPSALVVYNPEITLSQAMIAAWNPREAAGHIEEVEE